MPNGLSFRGRYACSCLVEWLPWYERMLVKRGVISRSLDIFQLNGNAAASAGTHKGGAFDLAQYSTLAISIARQMGAATWHRTPAQGFMHHAHGVLNGCPHLASLAATQVSACKAGYNGLGYLGRGGRDDNSTNVTRTWSAGVKWAQAQLDEFTPDPPIGAGGGGGTGPITPLPPVKDDDPMPKLTPWRSNPDNQKVPARKWTTLRCDKGGAVSVINEAQDGLVAQIDASVIMAGLTATSVVQLRTYITDDKGKRLSSGYGQEYRGVSRLKLSTTDAPQTKNRRVYLEVWANVACTVTQVGARAAYWN